MKKPFALLSIAYKLNPQSRLSMRTTVDCKLFFNSLREGWDQQEKVQKKSLILRKSQHSV